MKHLVRLYEEAFRRHGDNPAAVLWPKGRQEERFRALTRHIDASTPFSLLDYGCGLGHLKAFLDASRAPVAYSGADLVPAFVEACRAKYSDASFFNAQSPREVPGQFDYVIASGAFNVRYGATDVQHRDAVFGMLVDLFNKAGILLAVDFMTDAVDYRQPDAYHQNVEELYRFITRLSRRVVIDQSYLPYEFAVTVWKSQEIVRPDNVYERSSP